ncbi:hypothetical protein DAEQUDRAFT_679161 [Daedalea quercina L-15889]|uniref:Uncharacterized protein n=1 Tax=Daedalea quercina L-15889 TaxID=1314783 RepID=A0A165L999_9APHY|nr:hypothetical protein DAEQUDRAFT_679161 [Daedalea quercina L-15889]
MKDAAKEEQCEAKVSIAIPGRLARPKYKRVPIEKALFMNEALRDIPIEYIQDELAQNGENLLGVLEHVQVPPPLPASIPQQIDVEVSDAYADLPTHMLAVYKKDLPEGERAVVTMLAAHQCVWDLNCAHLPSLPPSAASASVSAPATAAPAASEAPVRLTIPVVPLGLPNPEHFRELLCYMYTKRADELLSELLPAPPPSAAQGQDAMDRYARSLAREHERADLLQRMARVQGVWRNACALGVFDDGLWAMIDLAWDVYGKAVATDVPGRPTPVWDSSLKTLSFR